MFTNILDAFEVLEIENDDNIQDNTDDFEYFEFDIEEGNYISYCDSHRDMWHDFDEINPNDLPDRYDG